MGDRKLSILMDSDLEVCATVMKEFDSQQTYINELNFRQWTIWLDKPNSIFGLLCWSVLVWSFVSWIPSLHFCNLVFIRSSSCEQYLWNPSGHFDKECKVRQAISDKIVYYLILMCLCCTRFRRLVGLLWNLLE